MLSVSPLPSALPVPEIKAETQPIIVNVTVKAGDGFFLGTLKNLITIAVAVVAIKCLILTPHIVKYITNLLDNFTITVQHIGAQANQANQANQTNQGTPTVLDNIYAVLNIIKVPLLQLGSAMGIIQSSIHETSRE
ncbi:hypothetical protein [Candidatus Endomicrobiellum agilis]|uniref:hypothetical protein n=1 Tax=Candidatus Endomicrobiellum agilis TaxID=3238957 RepID=UPI003575430D|nr:hypothetical protein [Endomicrobium sp.]